MENKEIIPEFQATKEIIANRIDIFFDSVSLNKLASACGITKNKGVSAKKLLMMLFTLPFFGKNIYRAIVRDTDCEFGKDAVYDFLGSHRFSWRRLLLMVALKVISILDALTPRIVKVYSSWTTRPYIVLGPRKLNSSPESMTTPKRNTSRALGC